MILETINCTGTETKHYTYTQNTKDEQNKHLLAITKKLSPGLISLAPHKNAEIAKYNQRFASTFTVTPQSDPHFQSTINATGNNYTVFQKTATLFFRHNFGKQTPIFSILSL